ncbi:MAG TPA: hypothetical protein VIN58_21740 [Roseateles sp.]
MRDAMADTAHDESPAGDLASLLVGQALSLWSQSFALSWQSMLSWSRVSVELQKQVWDSWIAHWGGGVPLDG